MNKNPFVDFISKYKDNPVSFCEEVLEIAEKKGYENYLARAILFKSIILSGFGREKESLEKIQKSLEICKRIDGGGGGQQNFASGSGNLNIGSDELKNICKKYL